MKLALIRHGHALDHPRDELRQLSPLGVEQATKTGVFLCRVEFSPALFFHSPLKRAVETCQIINSGYFNAIPTKQCEELCPLSPLSFWLHNLDNYQQDLILVGHNPYMSNFAMELTGSAYHFPTGGCIILEKSPTTSNWFVSAASF